MTNQSEDVFSINLTLNEANTDESLLDKMMRDRGLELDAKKKLELVQKVFNDAAPAGYEVGVMTTGTPLSSIH